MCDGQHKTVQEYLREQKSSITSINIVEEMTYFLYEYSRRRQLTSDTLPLIAASLEALIELCSGNVDNIKVIFEKQILSIINYYLQIDITNINAEALMHTKLEDEDYVKLRINALKLKAAVVGLLDVMLERVSAYMEKLVQQIAEGVDGRALQYTLVDFVILKDDKELKKMEFDDNAHRALFKTYSVINHLAASGPNVKSKFGKLADDYTITFTFAVLKCQVQVMKACMKHGGSATSTKTLTALK